MHCVGLSSTRFAENTGAELQLDLSQKTEDRRDSSCRSIVNRAPTPFTMNSGTESLCTALSVNTFRSIIREHIWVKWRRDLCVISRALSSEEDPRIVLGRRRFAGCTRQQVFGRFWHDLLVLAKFHFSEGLGGGPVNVKELS